MSRLQRIVLWSLVAMVAVAVVLHGVIHDHHLDDPEWRTYFWNTVPVLKDVWFALMGFVGCALIVYVSKGIGKLWLQRPEGYYDGPEESE